MAQDPRRILFSPPPQIPATPMVLRDSSRAGGGMQPRPIQQELVGEGAADGSFENSGIGASYDGSQPPQQSSGVVINCYAPVHVHVYDGENFPRSIQAASAAFSVNGLNAPIEPQYSTPLENRLVTPFQQPPAPVKASRKRGQAKKKAPGAQAATKTDGDED